MSEPGANERRHDATARSETDTRERLVRVEANLETATRELGQVRARVHTIADSQGALVIMAQEGKEDRDKISEKLDRLDDKLDPLTVGQAQLATSYAAHVTQCAHDKTEFATAIDALKRTVWKAAGGLTVLWAAVTLALAIWKGVR
jgi:chromosome segregation ATPase